jgi:uncharacterized membrane protein HdeD (DUF308 family)
VDTHARYVLGGVLCGAVAVVGGVIALVIGLPTSDTFAVVVGAFALVVGLASLVVIVRSG